MSVPVINGQVTAAHSLRYYSLPGPEARYETTETELEDISRYVTIPGLLDQIENNLQQRDVFIFSCTFNSELGVPLTYSYVLDNVTDSGSGFSITEVEILP